MKILRQAALRIFVVVSIRRADYWLVEARFSRHSRNYPRSFNPPGGLLVG